MIARLPLDISVAKPDVMSGFFLFAYEVILL